MELNVLYEGIDHPKPGTNILMNFCIEKCSCPILLLSPTAQRIILLISCPFFAFIESEAFLFIGSVQQRIALVVDLGVLELFYDIFYFFL